MADSGKKTKKHTTEDKKNFFFKKQSSKTKSNKSGNKSRGKSGVESSKGGTTTAVPINVEEISSSISASINNSSSIKSTKFNFGSLSLSYDGGD